MAADSDSNPCVREADTAEREVGDVGGDLAPMQRGRPHADAYQSVRRQQRARETRDGGTPGRIALDTPEQVAERHEEPEAADPAERRSRDRQLRPVRLDVAEVLHRLGRGGIERGSPAVDSAMIGANRRTMKTIPMIPVARASAVYGSDRTGRLVRTSIADYFSARPRADSSE